MENKNLIMNSYFEKNSSIIKLVYEINDDKIIPIFNHAFVKKNIRNCKMIINNKIHLLTNKYEIHDKNMKLLKIKLLNTKKIDLSFMFFNCDSLREFKLITDEENKPEEEKKLNKEEDSKKQSKKTNTDNFYNSSNQINKAINKVEINTNNKTSIFEQVIQKFYYIYKNNKNRISDNEKKIFDFIINCNDNILLPSYSSINSKNNNDKSEESSSFNENSFSLKFWKIKRLNIKNNSEEKSSEKGCIIATDLSYKGCSSLITLPDISNWNTHNLKNMNGAFYKCSSLVSIPDISKWNTDKLENIQCLFSNCKSLKNYLIYLTGILKK